MERDTIITNDEEIELHDSDSEEPELPVVQSLESESDSASSSDEQLIEEDLPEIEVDEWIDLEDKWEKDYCFVVFTDEELYQYLYALYYPLLKDERASQRMALLQQRVLKQVIQRLQHKTKSLPPFNLIPVLNGQRANMVNSFGFYLKDYRESTKKPYLLTQPLLDALYPKVFETNKEEPYYTAVDRIEFQVISEIPLEEPKKKKGKYARKKKAVKKDEEGNDEEEKQPMQEIKDTYVVLEKDGTPLPVRGMYKKPFYDERYIPMLYLHERVSWKNASMDESDFIPLKTEEEESKPIVKQSKLVSYLRKQSKYSFDEIIPSMISIPSFHELTVLLASYGFNIHTLLPNQVQLLDDHLKTLVATEKRATKTTSVRFSWTHKPLSHIFPSEFSIWSQLKSWVEESMETYETMKDELEDQLKLLESNKEIFSKNPTMPLDIYEIAMKMKNDHLELDEVIQTLQSMYKEAQLSDYTLFLKNLLECEWDLDVIERKLSECKRMDASIQAERSVLLETYDYSQEVLKGKRSFMIEDMNIDDVIEEGGGADDQGDEINANDDIDMEDTLPIVPFEEESSTALVQMIPARISQGQREICMYVVKLLTMLQKTVELPLDMASCIESLLKNIDRKSQYESLCEKLPEIPVEDLKSVFEQNAMFLAIGDPELEERFKVAYKEVVKEYRKSILDALFYSLTWWVIVLQESYIQNPQSLQPGFLPCMPVWAFYGTPMSSSDEKGVARYIVCAIDYLRKQDQDSSIWKLLDSYTEQNLLDKIYKMSKHDDFSEQVAGLKQEWKDRWKEVAKKEKEMDVRLETLEKASHKTPQEYLNLYVELVKRLPTILSQKHFDKRHSIVVPLANSCCLQPLNSKFQPYSDIKDTPLYEKRSIFFSKPSGKQHIPVFSLGKVVVDEIPKPIEPGREATECLPESIHMEPPKQILEPVVKTVTVEQWNQLCVLIHKIDWKLPVLTENAPMEHITSSHIQRAIRDLLFYIERRVSYGKKYVELWKQFLERQSWTKKISILNLFMQYYYKEKSQYASLEWIEVITSRCIQRLKLIQKELFTWRTTESIHEGCMYLLDYILLLAVIMPGIPSEDYKSISIRWDGFDLETIDQKWIEEIIDVRMTNTIASFKLQNTPSNTEIQDYYANMRERLKETNLAEYKSKSIEEIQEIQEVKRLKLKKVADDAQSKLNRPTDDTLRPIQTDADIENEGENEYRRGTENPDDNYEDRIDE
jgi:hypothetical protein